MLLRQLARTVATAFAIALLASCSAIDSGTLDIAYEHADWLLQKMSTHYVELDKGQAEALRARLDRLHAWHRTQELPMYADLLDQAAERVARRLSKDDIDWMIHSFEERRRVGAAAVSKELAPLLLTLSASQQAQIAGAMTRDNARFAKTQLEPDAAALSKERTKWLAGQVERWTGKLTPGQFERVRRVALATADFPAERLEQRRRWQAALLRNVRQYHDELALGAALTELLASPRSVADDGYIRAVARLEDELTQMILDLDRTLTVEQRAAVVTHLHTYSRRLRELAARSA
ncbi:MAG TPA: DUF6279 family lipoprotein [Burkholderiales bacterium]|nr:DUF6279 family lipoprotein [Burkholderiales bacterium]